MNFDKTLFRKDHILFDEIESPYFHLSESSEHPITPIQCGQIPLLSEPSDVCFDTPCSSPRECSVSFSLPLDSLRTLTEYIEDRDSPKLSSLKCSPRFSQTFSYVMDVLIDDELHPSPRSLSQAETLIACFLYFESPLFNPSKFPIISNYLSASESEVRGIFLHWEKFGIPSSYRPSAFDFAKSFGFSNRKVSQLCIGLARKDKGMC
ncbi:hypothetical protein ADUPG1_012884 [Aduncisulcus paluster]|uniref:Uncharacterized protein n=1 Tax=Aduncisulcus paluster TaxID=2918883 RepID=A0ABQ5K106_9EUKA|nr:hypothetical protein ADUPG1_012884 [Aduncisulcus paluster]|eukprot:gnl/Carplike_NY0171/3638_a4913_395.p1 GENE.gnl/Carplike_NY0171/3638_a4913_395~~gnl/Carplike_NY0171/3638_a4913_395.p1  ORF type:complete len:207 (+),score=21.15 gnl/Carplike_NY0171/3638_a4913_395:3-623(+)